MLKSVNRAYAVIKVNWISLVFCGSIVGIPVSWHAH